MRYVLTICINMLYINFTEFPAVSCYGVSYFRIQMRMEVFILSCLPLEFDCYWPILRMMVIDKIFQWANLLTEFQYTCNRKFDVNEVHEKLSQRVFLKHSLVHWHNRKIYSDTLFLHFLVHTSWWFKIFLKTYEIIYLQVMHEFLKLFWEDILSTKSCWWTLVTDLLVWLPSMLS